MEVFIMKQIFILSLSLLFLLTTLALSSDREFANPKQSMPKLERAPVLQDRPYAPLENERGVMSAPPQLNSILIDSARNGYGFSSSGPKSADMTTDLTNTDWLGMVYRKFVPGDPNTGIIGVAELNVTAGFDYSNFTFWDYINNMSPYGIGGRYPSFHAAPEGPVPVWNQYFSGIPPTTVSDAFLSFDFFGWGSTGGGFIPPESWSQNSDPNVIHSLWLGNTDLYKDDNGTYHAGGVWEIGLNEGNYTFIHGESSDLMTWTWENATVDWSNLEFDGNSPRFAWGSNGFGVWVSTGYFVGGNDDFKLMVATTNDYGQTWSPISRLDWQDDLGIQEYISASDSIYVPNPNPPPDTILYVDSAYVGITYDFDVTVTPNNDIHIGCTIAWGPSAGPSSYYPHGLWMGLYDMHSEDQGQTWTASRIYWNSGLLVGDSTGSWTTTNEIDLGYDLNGNIYAGWVDRDRTNPVPSPYPRTNSNITSHYNLDVWASMSTDGGNTWRDTPIQVTDDQQNCAYGLRLAHRNIWNAAAQGKTYILYQIADLNRPLTPPVEILADHVQWYYVAEADSLGITGIQNDPKIIADQFTVHQNYPNPFNPATTIRIDLAKRQSVQVSVYNTLGQKVADLHNGVMNPGANTLTWNAENMASGIYLLKVKAQNRTEVRKMMLMK